MTAIYKQELDTGRPIFLKNNAKILKVLDMQIQNQTIVFWYEADLDTKEDYVCFDYWTGDKINPKANYIGTIQQGLVYHFYYIKQEDFDIKEY